MRHLLIATALALVAAAPANAQIIILDGSVPTPPGFYSIRTPQVYGNYYVNNGVVTGLPTYPSYPTYPTYGYPGITPYSGYPSHPGPYPFSPSNGYGAYPGFWRP